MANRRELVKRRNAARNIRKITRTMQLIATARFQAAYNRAMASKPYTRKLAELAADLSRATEGAEHPLMRAGGEARREVLLVLTSDRGLCGGYNSNVLRTAVEHLDARQQVGAETEVQMVGKKGVSYFRFLGRSLAETFTGIADRPRFEEIEPLADRLMSRFVAGEVAAVGVAYMRFLSASRQRPVVLPLLPLAAAEGEPGEAAEEKGRRRTQYEFSPAPRQLLDDLLPATVRVRLYQCFTDAAVSEQVARMVAMKAATDAAGDMIRRLTQQYNRARQTAITLELLDIVGGANALAGE